MPGTRCSGPRGGKAGQWAHTCAQPWQRDGRRHRSCAPLLRPPGRGAPPALIPAPLTAPMQVRCGPAVLSFHGSLLQLRGTRPGSTPLQDARGNVLLFNGQIFSGGVEVPPGTNDAAALLQALGQPGADVPAVLTSLRGPWALAFWQAASRTLWFGRDPIGKQNVLLYAGLCNKLCMHCVPTCALKPAWHACPSADVPLCCCTCACLQGGAACCCTCPARVMAASCSAPQRRWTHVHPLKGSPSCHLACTACS